MLFEKNIERVDYLEIVLSSDEYQNLEERGVGAIFLETNKNDLNIFIRVDRRYEEEEEGDE
jgi:hypothetical protein